MNENELESELRLVFRREATEFYGLRSEWLQRLFLAVTGTNTRLRDLFHALGHDDEAIPTVPDNVGGRFSVFTPAGLLPAALMGLDVMKSAYAHAIGAGYRFYSYGDASLLLPGQSPISD